MISCIVLSAGLSSRFKSPKALALIENIPAITYLLGKLCVSQISDIVIVLGKDKESILPHIFKHKLIRVVYNNDYKLGQTSSVQTGLKKLSSSTKGFTILPIDCPFVKTETINSLIAYFKKNYPDILIPTYNGLKGHPPMFRSELKKEILKIPHTKGLNSITQNSIYKMETLDLPDPGITQTFNTPEELSRILKSKDCSIT
jgi:CTP:molybdopterin cytidylyltransferase MocA